jgi:hypothetical protein
MESSSLPLATTTTMKTPIAIAMEGRETQLVDMEFPQP